MTIQEAKKLKPHWDWVLFAGGSYEFAGLGPTVSHLYIYDEPPSLHVDMILIKDCKVDKIKQKQNKPKS